MYFFLLVSMAMAQGDVQWEDGYCGGSQVGVCADGVTVATGGSWCGDKGTRRDCYENCVKSGSYKCCSWKDEDQCRGYDSFSPILPETHDAGYVYLNPADFNDKVQWKDGYCGGSQVGVCADGVTVATGGSWCEDKGTQRDCYENCGKSGSYKCCSWKNEDQCRGYDSFHPILPESHDAGYVYLNPADFNDCPGPYKVATEDNRCVWSCSEGTTPGDEDECVCQEGFIKTSLDEFGRKICTECPGPYKVATEDGRCVWSCSEGTTPGDEDECVCQEGLTETSVDEFGRKICTDESDDQCLEEDYACENYVACCAGGGYLQEGRGTICENVSDLHKTGRCNSAPAACCSIENWTDDCYTMASENNFNHACNMCASSPCQAACEINGEPSSQACFECCSTQQHEIDWQCELEEEEEFEDDDSDDNICPDGMTFLDKDYFDEKSEEYVSCSKTNDWCVENWDLCGGKAIVQEYFSGTECCESEDAEDIIIISDDKGKDAEKGKGKGEKGKGKGGKGEGKNDEKGKGEKGKDGEMGKGKGKNDEKGKGGKGKWKKGGKGKRSKTTDVICGAHEDCGGNTPFCYSGRCTSCYECHYCHDGVDGTCGPCGEGFPTMEDESCSAYGLETCVEKYLDQEECHDFDEIIAKSDLLQEHNIYSCADAVSRCGNLFVQEFCKCTCNNAVEIQVRSWKWNRVEIGGDTIRIGQNWKKMYVSVPHEIKVLRGGFTLKSEEALNITGDLWDKWKCGKKNEWKMCTNVREGKFHKKGTYRIEKMYQD